MLDALAVHVIPPCVQVLDGRLVCWGETTIPPFHDVPGHICPIHKEPVHVIPS